MYVLICNTRLIASFGQTLPNRSACIPMPGIYVCGNNVRVQPCDRSTTSSWIRTSKTNTCTLLTHVGNAPPDQRHQLRHHIRNRVHHFPLSPIPYPPSPISCTHVPPISPPTLLQHIHPPSYPQTKTVPEKSHTLQFDIRNDGLHKHDFLSKIHTKINNSASKLNESARQRGQTRGLLMERNI